MGERERQIEAFLRAAGFARAQRQPLAGDASARRYQRLHGGPRPAVLMDAPPGVIDVRPFLAIAGWLRGRGWSAPEVLAADPVVGLVLLEDLGDALFTRTIAAAPALEEPLYAAAIDLLVAIQRAEPPADLPPYDDAWLLREAALLTEWFASDLGERAGDEYLDAWRETLPQARAGADALVYVDYHADNLLWLPERDGLARVGLLDFQDARLGPPAYDLASLLLDARRDVDPALAARMIERYLAARPELRPDAFAGSFAILGVQRNAKILGLFTRLARRDGKPRYLAPLPRVRAHLVAGLDHPALGPVRAWFERHLPLR
jgi:N-acetylmuramate 1-kinase